MMSGTKAGVAEHDAWSPKDIEAHLSILRGIAKELSGYQRVCGSFCPAIVVRGEKNVVPVTDNIFPESKEFLLGFWIVDVVTPERLRHR